MTIQYASDLHLEFEENSDYLKANPLEVAGDILILAGDTIYFGEKMHEADWFFDWCSASFKQTYLIPGNHEYYGGFPIENTVTDFELKVRDNVTYLNNRSIIIGSAELFFTTLWTRIPPEESYTIEKIMRDCHYGRFNGRSFRSRAWNSLHRTCTEWLSSALAASNATHKIVVTHHCPHRDERGAAYQGKMAEKAYMTDMHPLMEGSGIEYWIHGHIHLQLESAVDGIKVISNPLGYVDDGENSDFKTNATIVL